MHAHHVHTQPHAVRMRPLAEPTAIPVRALRIVFLCHDTYQDRHDGAEWCICVAHDDIHPLSKLIAFGASKVEFYHVLLLTATSPQDRLVVGLKCVGDSTCYSPKRKKAKNTGAAMAHTRVLSGPQGVVDPGEDLDGYG